MVIVITVIESLRAFDLPYIINKGLNGLELLSTLVTNNILGETARVGFGSAIAVVLHDALDRTHRHLPVAGTEGRPLMSTVSAHRQRHAAPQQAEGPPPRSAARAS